MRCRSPNSSAGKFCAADECQITASDGAMPVTPEFAPDGAATVPIHLVCGSDLTDLHAAAGSLAASWAQSNGFSAKAGEMLTVPDRDGNLSAVLVGDPRGGDRPAQRFFLAGVLEKLGSGNYRLEGEFTPEERDEAALASLFAQYRFDRYSERKACHSRLALPDGCDRERLLAVAAGEFTSRDLINTPASGLGPGELESCAADLADAHSARFSVTDGDRLETGFPLIHSVGAAGPPPRLLDLKWGAAGPKLTLIGKGVCFDTGGLNIKPGRSMGLMKKDMGGAASAIGIAEMIMRLDLPLRLRLLIPAVENAISGNAMRPGDVLRSRSGRTVEITNTDAEGRLVLADAIDYAQEDGPDLMVTMATLTGAARVALGPEVVPFYTDSDKLAGMLGRASGKVRDPVWRMPLWRGYEKMLKSDIADCVNAAETGFAGSITAALFLRQFVKRPGRWLHFDLYCWQNQTEPGFPKGGTGQAARALLEALPEALKL